MTAAATTGALRPDRNLFGGWCRECDIRVEPECGTRTRRGFGRWEVLCASHSRPLRAAGRSAPPPVTAPPAPPAASDRGNAAPRVCDAAVRSAAAMLAAAEADPHAPEGAVEICREIAACVRYCAALGAPVEIVITEHADGRVTGRGLGGHSNTLRGPTVTAAPAGDDLVAEILARSTVGPAAAAASPAPRAAAPTPAPRKPAKPARPANLAARFAAALADDDDQDDGQPAHDDDETA